MSTKIVVLGILMEGNNHPYEIQQLIKRRKLDEYIKIQKGSLYYTVEQLEKDGLIKVDSVIRYTNHPDKTVYEITDAGKKEFHRLLTEELLQPQHVYFPLNEAIAFMKHLNPEELIPTLKVRLADVQKYLDEFHSSYEYYELKIPKYGAEIMASGLEYCKIEMRLLQNIIHDLEDGSFTKLEKASSYSAEIENQNNTKELPLN